MPLIAIKAVTHCGFDMAVGCDIATPSVAIVPGLIFLQTDIAFQLLAAKDGVLLTAPLLADWIVLGCLLADAAGDSRFSVLDAFPHREVTGLKISSATAFPFLTEEFVGKRANACLLGQWPLVLHVSTHPPKAEFKRCVGGFAAVGFTA